MTHVWQMRCNLAMRYLLPLLLVLLLAACDRPPAPLVPPSPSADLPAVTPTVAAPLPTATPSANLPSTPAPTSGVPGPAQRYTITLDDLLPGYRFVGQEQGRNFYVARYEMAAKFRKFEQTIYLFDSPDQADAQMPSLLDAFTATMRERTTMPLTEVVSGTIGDAMLARQYHWGAASSERGGVDIAFRYANVVAIISYSYDAPQMADVEAMERARGLVAIILGKLISHLEPNPNIGRTVVRPYGRKTVFGSALTSSPDGCSSG